MSEFVEQQQQSRGRTRSKAFHEDAQIYVSTDGPSNGRKYTSSEDEDLDETPICRGRSRSSSFHEDDAETSEKKNKKKNRGKVSTASLRILNNPNPDIGPPKQKSKKKTKEEIALEKLENQVTQPVAKSTDNVNGKKKEESKEEFDVYVKILLLGDSGVGKTCLLKRYKDNNYKHNFISTVGIDYKVHYTNIDNKRVKCQIWDTAGQERFHVITRAYYKGSHGIVLVFDITEKSTFTNIEYWMKNISQHANTNVQIILVGNKSDLAKKRQVTAEEAEAVATKYNILYFETSAKTGSNVDNTFYNVSKLIIENEGGKTVNIRGAGIKDKRKFEEKKEATKKRNGPKCTIM
jgi:small GTP-binding protein